MDIYPVCACRRFDSSQSVSPSTAVRNSSSFSNLKIFISIACLTGPTLAGAQQQAPEEIYVTGSRLRQTGFDTPNPVTVLDSDYMETLGLVNISDVLAQVPQNQPYVTPTNIGLGNFNVGASLANLRGMNPYYGTRTLTLVDGRRHVPSTNGGAVDLNLIPSLLVARSETVTGGASAAYGTDAVAGVVNMILDTRLTGIRAQVDYGQSFRSDGEDFHGAFAGGTGFAGERGHVIFGGEYQHAGEIGDCASSRLWCAESWDDLTNPGYSTPSSATYGEPNFVIAPNSRSDNQTFTGVFPTLKKKFNDAGTALLDYDPGKYSSVNNFLPFQGHSGGDGPSVYSSLKLRVPVERYSMFGHADFALTDRIQGFLELSYGKRESTNIGWAFGPGVVSIKPDNAYLTPAVAAVITTTTRFNRVLVDKIRQTNETKNESYRVVAGANGELFADWTWDFYYQYGRNEQSQRLHNNKVNSFFNYALDAVIDTTTTRPACRALVANATINPYFATNGKVDPGAAGCVPINLFGLNNITPEAIAYTHRTLMEDFGYDQHVVAAHVAGDLFEGFGSGPAKAAAGIEYRNDNGNVSHGNLPYYDQFALSYQLDFAGKQQTIEGFAELNMPLLRDSRLADLFEINAAVRQTHTKSTDVFTSSSQSFNITTWKVGSVFDPTRWLRLRATRSRDIRAAGFRELYIRQTRNLGTGLGGSVINRWTSVTADVTQSLGGGNVNLVPEHADTWTVGLVLQPEGLLDRFRLSVDWYQIKLNDAINTNVGNQTIVDLCWQVRQYCDRIEGTANGSGGFSDITFVDSTAVNFAQIVSRGIDLEAAYVFNLDSLSDRLRGTVTFRALGAYQYDFIVDSGGLRTDYAGQSGPLAAFVDWNPAPYWIWNGWLTYSNGPFSFTMQGRYIGPGAYRRDRVGPEDAGYDPTKANSINDNRVPDRLYLNISGSYSFALHDKQSIEFFASISNLLDTDPPIAPGGNGGATNPVYFDVVGATFRTGLRLRY